MATRSGLRDGDATRRLLVDAASKLFASNGVEGVSIRAVNAEAGVGPASVHYHFGSKDALLDAVLLQEGAGVIARVTELASDLEVCPRPPTARELVDVLATPYQELMQRDPVRGARWLAISGQLSLANDARLFDTSQDAVTLFRRLLARAYPAAPPTSRESTWAMAVNMLIVMIGRWATSAPTGAPAAADQLFETLAEFVAGGIDHALAAAVDESAVAAAGGGRRL